MGRKSLKSERTDQILDAYERCIVKFGFEKSTLQKIANEAGVTRSILRHYIGNRSEIARAVVMRVAERYKESLLHRMETIPDRNRLDLFVDFYFEGWFESGRDDDTILNEIINASERDEDLRKTILAMYKSFESNIAEEFLSIYPHAPVDKCHLIAHAFMCLAYGHSEMLWLGFDPSQYVGLKGIVVSLIKELEKEHNNSVARGGTS